MGLDLHAKVTLDAVDFEKGMHRMGEAVTDGIKNFALGAIGIGTVEQAISKTIDSAAELVNSAKNLSMTTDQLQLMRKAAEENGKSFESMTNAVEKFNAVRENILNGGKGAEGQMAAMQRLGVTPDALKNQTAATNMMGPIATTAQKSNAADIANDLKKVFGKGGDELFGTLRTNFDELGATMKRTGQLMDGVNAIELKQFKDELATSGQIIEAQLAPALVLLSKGVILAMAGFGAYVAVLKSFNWKDFFTGGINGGASAQGMASAKKILEDALTKVMTMDDNARVAAMTPVTPQSTETADGKDPKVARGRKLESDSLLKVGNFLGSNVGNTAAHAAAQHAATTAHNTTQIAQYTKMTADMIGKLYGGRGPERDQNDQPISVQKRLSHMPIT